MAGESDLNIILKTIKPILNDGEYVFSWESDNHQLIDSDLICLFKEREGITDNISKVIADKLKLPYSFVSPWISLTVHSSLESVGLTAAFSNGLVKDGIGCNVVAA